MDYEELNKPGFKPKYTSEFSMGMLDFIRYNKWLEYIEHWSASINSTIKPTLEMIQHYFAGLNVLWKLWRPIVSIPKVATEIDDAIEEAKKRKRVWERLENSSQQVNPVLINKLVDILDSVHTRLMYIKQVVGLGIVVKKNFSASERIKKGMRGTSINKLNLPDV